MSEKIVELKSLFKCPIKCEYTNNPVMSKCCGRVFDSSVLFTYLMGNLNKICPVCNIPMRTILDQNSNSLKKIANLIENM